MLAGPSAEKSSGVDPHAPDPASIRGLPVYPNSSPKGMISPPKVQGVPMALSWFETRDPVESVLAFYDNYLTLAEIHHATHMFHANAGYSGWLEAKFAPTKEGFIPVGYDAGYILDGVMHVATALRQGDKTVVLLSAMEPVAVLRAQAPQLPPGLVLPPSATKPQVFELGETPGARIAVHARVAGGALADAVLFYERHFKEGNWVVSESRTVSERSATMTATRGNDVQMISLQAGSDGVSLLLHSLHSEP
jgi:hypothetical protein